MGVPHKQIDLMNRMITSLNNMAVRFTTLLKTTSKRFHIGSNWMKNLNYLYCMQTTLKERKKTLNM